MRVVIQRVSEASVSIDNNVHAEIGKGMVVLLGIAHDDDESDCMWMAKKISQLRIFNDTSGKMNLDINSFEGEVLVISQFTLFASYKKGNRPSYLNAALPDVAIPIYQTFLSTLQDAIKGEVKSGIFGADMRIFLINSGPVTIQMDSKNPE